MRKKITEKSVRIFFRCMIITMGIASLKEKQEAAIMSFLGGRDTVVSLRLGKSLIYALLPYACDIIRGWLANLFQNYSSNCIFFFQQLPILLLSA